MIIFEISKIDQLNLINIYYIFRFYYLKISIIDLTIKLFDLFYIIQSYLKI
jgi:hypothetical protein